MRSSQRFSMRTRCLLLAFSSLASLPLSAIGQPAEHSPPLRDLVSQRIALALTQRRSLTTVLEHGLPNEQHPWRCSLSATLSRVRTINQCVLAGDDAPPKPQCMQIGIEYSCKNL